MLLTRQSIATIGSRVAAALPGPSTSDYIPTHVAPIHPVQIAITALYGMVIAYSAQLLYHCIAKRMDANHKYIRIAKCIMAGSMLIKAILFEALGSNRIACSPIIHSGDLFYHISMTAGLTVLLLRIRVVFPTGWKTSVSVFHFSMVVARLSIGVVDVSLLTYELTADNLCIYDESYFWGALYTFYDMITDLYVTGIIAYALMKHIRELKRAHAPFNDSSYFVIIAQNVTRTTILTLSNLATVILLLLNLRSVGIMVIWPVVNTLTILLIGYDIELSLVIQRLRRSLLDRRDSPDYMDRHPYDIELDGGRDHMEVVRDLRPIPVPCRSDTPSFMASSQSFSFDTNTHRPSNPSSIRRSISPNNITDTLHIPLRPTQHTPETDQMYFECDVPITRSAPATPSSLLEMNPLDRFRSFRASIGRNTI